MSVQNDVDNLADALTYLARVMHRPRTWEEITKRAGVAIDRPGAAILHTLTVCEKEKTDCNIQHLAHALGIEAPSVSRKVQELEQAGLLTRKHNDQDRRTVILHLTRKGRAVFARIHQAKRENLAELLQNWRAADRQKLITLLHCLATDMNKEQQPL